jgi:hypothetical protein
MLIDFQISLSRCNLVMHILINSGIHFFTYFFNFIFQTAFLHLPGWQL